MKMNFRLKVLLILIVLLQGCSSKNNIQEGNISGNEIIKVTIFYNSLRKDDALTLQNTLNKNGYLVSIETSKTSIKRYSSYMFVDEEDHKSAVILNSIVHKHLKHNLNVNFFKEKGSSGLAKIILTNTEFKDVNLQESYTPQLWSHHKKLKISPELCASKGVNVLNSLGFTSVVKNGNYVYGNFNRNRAAIKCVEFENHTFVYTAVAGKNVKTVEKLRNNISRNL
jgi:hypothetical protein